jgi:hypothetical protein
MKTDDNEPFDPDSYVPQPTDYGAEDQKNFKFQIWIGVVVIGAFGLLKALN